MGLNILLRSSDAVSYFKRYLLKLLQMKDLTEVVLCSGYFQEDLWAYSVLHHDDLLKTIQNHPNFGGLKFHIVAGKFKTDKKTGKIADAWYDSYKSFLQELSKAHVNFDAYVAKKKNWHAKIVLFISNGVPVAGIIGSSNLTKPAVNENYNFFNFECDVVIWTKKRRLNKVFREEVPQQQGDSPFAPLVAQLSPSYPQQDEEARLKAIYKEIMSQEDLDRFDAWRK